MRLAIATREDPQTPLARLRGGGQLSELRVTDLHFSHFEAAALLNQAMGLKLSSDDIAVLETRTEGWGCWPALGRGPSAGTHRRKRLHQSGTASSAEFSELHRRSSRWYEVHGMEIEAFLRAAAANDVERAERLIEGRGVPLQYRGAGVRVLKWLESLPTSVLDARPSLWVTYATA